MARILVVDDEEPVRAMIRQMLEGAGHVVEEAEDGEAGIRAYRTRPSDLVITDILMPNKGGLVAIKEMRAAFPDARVIAISGGGRTGRLSFLSTARTFPGVRTLKKPFRRADLLSLVDEVLGGAA
ncbi:MAG: response regulator [Proteobacteria bacterium]|nr:response regulator [Pseudomonadota bacterium]